MSSFKPKFYTPPSRNYTSVYTPSIAPSWSLSIICEVILENIYMNFPLLSASYNN